MAKCKYCEKVSLFLSSKELGFCRSCEEKFVPVISRCGEAIKRGLVRAKYSENHDAILAGLEEAGANARVLLRFERMGVQTINPAPSGGSPLCISAVSTWIRGGTRLMPGEI